MNIPAIILCQLLTSDGKPVVKPVEVLAENKMICESTVCTNALLVLPKGEKSAIIIPENSCLFTNTEVKDGTNQRTGTK
jgi:hypothetical protein